MTIKPPADSGQPQRTFTTLPLEAGEVRSLMIVAPRMLETPCWSVEITRLSDDKPEEE